MKFVLFRCKLANKCDNSNSQSNWNDLDHCRSFVLLWSECGGKSSNGAHLCRRLVFTTIILGCDRCRHLLCYQVRSTPFQLFTTSFFSLTFNSFKSNNNKCYFLHFVWYSIKVAWFCRIYSSKPKRRRRRKVQF